MRYLTDAPAQEWTTNHHKPVIEHKTRISFEVHSSVILDNILSDFDGLAAENDNLIKELLFGLYLTNGEQEAGDNKAQENTTTHHRRQ